MTSIPFRVIINSFNFHENSNTKLDNSKTYRKEQRAKYNLDTEEEQILEYVLSQTARFIPKLEQLRQCALYRNRYMDQ